MHGNNFVFIDGIFFKKYMVKLCSKDHLSTCTVLLCTDYLILEVRIFSKCKTFLFVEVNIFHMKIECYILKLEYFSLKVEYSYIDNGILRHLSEFDLDLLFDML